MIEANIYRKSLQQAVEYVYVVASRRGLDIAQLIAQIDPGRDPALHKHHVLTISIRGTDLSVVDENIPHDWIQIGTGFIDARFSRRIAFLLTDLEKKWVR